MHVSSEIVGHKGWVRNLYSDTPEILKHAKNRKHETLSHAMLGGRLKRRFVVEKSLGDHYNTPDSANSSATLGHERAV